MPTLAAVIRAAFEEYRGRLIPPSGAHDETVSSISAKLATSRAVLALVNSQAAGAVLYEPESDYVYLGRLAVLPRYRRLGIGRELVNWVETRAYTLGYTRVHLGVRIALTRNRAYFESLGYRVVSYGIHPGFVEPTYVNMEKYI